MKPTVLLRQVCAPEVLHRVDGYTLWHGGITDGPHGLSLIVEVLDESGAGRMSGDDWQSGSHRRWPVEVSATVPDGPTEWPQETIEARSPHYYRLVGTFGKFGRSLGPRTGLSPLRLDFRVYPLDVRVTRHVEAYQP